MKKKPVDLATVRRVRAELRQLVAEHPELTSEAVQARLGRYLEGEQGEDMAKEEKLEKPLGLRVSQEDIDALDEAAALVPFASRHAVARAAIRIGLEEIKRDPTRLLTVDAKKKAKPSRKPKR